MGPRTAATAVLIATMTFGGCSTGDGPEPRTSGTPDSDPTTELSPVEAGVEAAKALVTESDTGRFTSESHLSGYTIRRDGSFRASDMASSFSTVVSGKNTATARFHTITTGTFVYLRIDRSASVSMRRCWLGIGPGDADAVARSTIGVTLGMPGEVTTVLAAGVQGGVPTTNLYAAASVLGAGATAAIGLDATTILRTPFEITATSDSVTWNADAANLAAAAELAGLAVPTDVPALQQTDIEVRLTRPGSRVDVAAPDRDVVVPYDPGTTSAADLATAVARCERG